MRQYTGDAYADFLAHDAEREAWLSKLPVCEICGHPIQDEHFYEINDEPVCEKCLDRHFRRETDNYI